ncbi:MAG: MFS transporter [Anaerolineae bacterium]|mgnify:CR=1 FL=1|jgi:MFS transporter, FHS family, Na+ dependent glucose transporter 1|nr:MFS transporter [Anaerolineae bacterium]MBT7326126.1 MFS transporter [Anaerolineae bacterium]
MAKNLKLRNSLSYYLVFISLGLGLGIVGPALPSLAEQTGSTLGAIGSLFLLSSIGGMLGTALSGRIYDRVKNGHLILGLAQLVSAIGLGLTPLAGSLPVLLSIALISGVSLGIINSGANILLMWTHKKDAGPYVNGLHFSFGVGAFLAPTIFAQVLNLGGTYQQTYWVLAGLGIPIALWMLFLSHSPSAPAEEESVTKGKGYLRKVLPMVVIAMLFLFFYVGSELTYGNWIYTYALTMNLADVTQAAYLTSGFWLSFTIGRAFSIFAAARFKAEHVLTIAFLGGIVALVLAIAAPQSINVLWAATIGIGFFMAPIWATGYNLAGQSIKLTATISSIIILGDSFGGVVLPSLTGAAIEHLGAESMPWLVFGAFAINGFVFVLMLAQRKKGITNE